MAEKERGLSYSNKRINGTASQSDTSLSAMRRLWRRQAYMRYISWVIFIVTGIPLIAYPIVILANLMSCMGHPGQGTGEMMLFASLFFILTTTYPIPYVYSLRKVQDLLKRNEDIKAFYFSLIPLFWFSLILLVTYAWDASEAATYA